MLFLKPVVTERAVWLKEKQNRHALWVEGNATKGEIRRELKQRFGVDCVSIRTFSVRGKLRRSLIRRSGTPGYQPARKKAIVRLAAGQTLKWPEGQK